MKIVCLIATWHDEQLLAEAVASARPHVDEVIVLDGAYEGLRVWPHSTRDELDAAVHTGALVFNDRGHYWPSEIAKRNVLLELGRAFVDSEDEKLIRWALVLDADELLVNGEQLREYLRPRAPDYAPGLPRVEPDGNVWFAPSRLFRLDDVVRYRGRSYFLDYCRADGGVRYRNVVDLSHNEVGHVMSTLVGMPHVKHQWDRRSPGRAAIQRDWGRLLAAADGIA